VLQGVEVELARFVGPVARVLVRRAAQVHKDMESLVAAVAENLDLASDREAFVRAVTGHGLVAKRREAEVLVDADSTPGGVPAFALTPADVERATQLLTAYIGPIARVVVKRAAGNASSRRAFLSEVAQSVENEAQRERFLREAAAAG
jgi:serine/threonine-protein kinase